jgi:hypothetical protein
MGNVIEHGLHDAELIGVEIDRVGAVARLTLQLEGGERRQVELRGLKAFRGEDLTLQNVVSRMLRSSRGEVSGDELNRWLNWATSLSDSRPWLSDQRRAEWHSACTSGALELVVFEPSAGAQVVAVCERLDVLRD